MSKDAVITELFSLPLSEQREIFAILGTRLSEADLSFSEDQKRELDARLDRFDREGSRGEPWEQVFAEIKSKLHASPDH